MTVEQSLSQAYDRVEVERVMSFDLVLQLQLDDVNWRMAIRHYRKAALNKCV